MVANMVQPYKSPQSFWGDVDTPPNKTIQITPCFPILNLLQSLLNDISPTRIAVLFRRRQRCYAVVRSVVRFGILRCAMCIVNFERDKRHLTPNACCPIVEDATLGLCERGTIVLFSETRGSPVADPPILPISKATLRKMPSGC